MKKNITLILISILLTISSCSLLVGKDSDEYIAKNAKPITGNEKIEEADFKNQNGFTVAMMIIGNFEDVIKQQKEGKMVMKFKSKSKIMKGDGADVVFDISGCSPNRNGFCEVFADIIGFDSNKKIYFEVKDFPLSVGSIKPKKNMFFLSETSLKFTSEKKDPLGEYLIKAKVKDKISGKENDLSIQFDVVDSRV
ncbi:MAG: hypothetical protein V4612_02480 [Pseudomonadota bacterium]